MGQPPQQKHRNQNPRRLSPKPGKVLRAIQFPEGIGENIEHSQTVPEDRNFAVPSGLSDERSRRKSLREEFWLRWQNFGSPGQLEIPRF